MRPSGSLSRVSLAAVLAGLVLGCASEPGPAEDGVARFLELYNTYNVVDALELVAEGIAVDIPDAAPLKGKAELGLRMRWDSVLATRFRASTHEVNGDTTVVPRLTETSAWLQLLGVASLEHEEARFVVRDGLIAEISLGELTPSSRESLERAYEDFLPWARHEYPERLGRVRPEGQFDYQPRRAADLLSLLRVWRRGVR